MTIYHPSYNTRCSKLDCEVNEAKTDYHRNRPWILSIGRLTPTKSSRGGKEYVCDHDR